jgi:hypothetical protein
MSKRAGGERRKTPGPSLDLRTRLPTSGCGALNASPLDVLAQGYVHRSSADPRGGSGAGMPDNGGPAPFRLRGSSRE